MERLTPGVSTLSLTLRTPPRLMVMLKFASPLGRHCWSSTGRAESSSKKRFLTGAAPAGPFTAASKTTANKFGSRCLRRSFCSRYSISWRQVVSESSLRVLYSISGRSWRRWMRTGTWRMKDDIKTQFEGIFPRNREYHTGLHSHTKIV